MIRQVFNTNYVVCYIKTPFNFLVVGATACSKTKYLLDMFENNYKCHFDYIVLICPTFEWNKTYQEWICINYPDSIAINCEQDKVHMILKSASDIYKGINTLIILDDCASSQGVKTRVSELVKLAFSARHYNLSTIVITQQLTSIAKPYRKNISKLVTFYNPNRNDMEVIMDDYLYGVSNDKM